MRLLAQCIVMLLFSNAIHAQVVSLIAGNGSSGDGTPAVSASVNDPNGMVVDKFGNIYIACNLDNRVRKIDTAGIITTIAGTGSAGFNGDSILATTAKLNQPTDLALDSVGNIYVADAANHRVRKISVNTGFITTVAGNGTASFSGDSGDATSASLFGPYSLCFDNIGNLYISDLYNYRIRKVDTAGIINTYAGSGTCCWTGDGGSATSAKIFPGSIKVDDEGNVYMASLGTGIGSSGGGVRKISASGIISCIAGDTVAWVYNGDDIPAVNARMSYGWMSFDNKRNLYLADAYNNRIRKIDTAGIIHTVVGTGVSGNTGDNGPADSAETCRPAGVAFDGCQNLYFSQVTIPRIRKITFNATCAPLRIPKELHDKLTIYPNPTSGELHIDNLTINTKYVVANIEGIIEQTGMLNEGDNTITIQSLPPGLHLLELIDDQGKKTVKKIVKE